MPIKLRKELLPDSSLKVKSGNLADTGKDGLPAPYSIKSNKNFSKVIGWPVGKTPVAPPGFTVTIFADNLKNPRWI